MTSPASARPESSTAHCCRCTSTGSGPTTPPRRNGRRTCCPASASTAGAPSCHEAGSPMTTGLNYGNHEGDVYTSYLGALTEVARDQGIGLVYWPGLRTNDAYTLTTLSAGWRARGDQRVGPGPDPVGLGSPRGGAAQRPAPRPSRRAAREREARRVRRRSGILDQHRYHARALVLQRRREPVVRLDGRARTRRLRRHVRGAGGRGSRGQPAHDRRLHGCRSTSSGSSTATSPISSVADPGLCLATPENEWGLALAPCDATATTQQWTRG